jgi:putative pyoverdin transport system ATP-binding/permease protein
LFRVFELLNALQTTAKNRRRSRLVITAAALACGMAGLGNTALIAVINTALITGASGRSPLVWAFLALCIAMPLASFVSQALIIQLTGRVARELRMWLCHQILYAPYRVQEELGSHKLQVTLSEDIPTVANTIASLPPLVTQLTILVGCLVYMGWLSWPLLLLIVGYMGLGLLTHRLPVRKSSRYFRRLREQWDDMYKAFRALTEGTKELKLNRERRDQFMTQDMEPCVEAIRVFGIKASNFSVAAGSWGQTLFFVFIGLTIFVIPLLTAVDGRTLTGYALSILFMISPMTHILNAIPTLERARVAAQKIKELKALLSKQSHERPAVTPAGKQTWRTLELLDVTHVYRHDGATEEFNLGPLTLTLTPGEAVFMIGGNGSGKTTLAKILVGLYEPEKGEVRLDGRLITSENRDEYRQYFSVVFSDFFLFERLFHSENGALACSAEEYLRQLQLDHKVRIENGKLSTTALSMGQRKRLALLMAYMEDRPIYIFDEWASDQDPLFKEIYYHSVLPDLKRRGKTVIVITHDDRYFDLADRLIKLDRGQIESDTRLQNRQVQAQTQPDGLPAVLGPTRLPERSGAAMAPLSTTP